MRYRSWVEYLLHCAISPLPSPAKAEVSFELKILLAMCLEGPLECEWMQEANS